MHTWAVSSFLFVMALLFAMFEIEAEGKFGWAEKFPTWYRTRGRLAKLYMRITHKPLTGYHASLFFVTLLLFMWPMVQTSTLSFEGIFTALGMYWAWIIVWDYSWFVLNPHYGSSGFRRNNVWWFANEPWVLGRIPLGYITSWITALAFASVGGLIGGDWHEAFRTQVVQLGWYLLGLLYLINFGAPLYQRYHSTMREHDDRSDAGIFH